MNDAPDFPIDPELEARIVAWVLGECSPFEAAELERRVAAEPALAMFKRRIEAVHGLVGDAVQPAHASLRLAPERRAKLLAQLGVPAGQAESGSVMMMKPLGSGGRSRIPVWLPALAASLVVGFFVVRTVERQEQASIAHHEESQRGKLALAEQTEAAKHREMAVGELASARRPATAPTDNFLAWKGPGQGPANIGGSAAVPMGSDSANVAMVETDNRVPPTASTEATALRFDHRHPLASNERTFSYYTAPARPFGMASARSKPRVRLPAEPRAMNFGTGESENLPGGESGDDVVTMSPFQVTAERDSGYVASSTMAGSRLNTTLRDFGSAISVVNRDFVASAAGSSQTPVTAQPSSESSLDFLSMRSAGNNLSLAGTVAGSSAGGSRWAQAAGKTAGGAGDAPVRHPAVLINDAVRAEVSADRQPLSTFSLHVSDVSLRLAQAALARGELPDPASVRPEEFYNAFDYGDPAPAAGEPVACRIEQAAHPFLQQWNLVRIALRVPASGRGTAQPLRLTVLVDTSGSMEREDRVATVRRAMGLLATLLGPRDQVTLIGFARQPRLLAENVPGNEAGKLADIVAHTPAEGGTNLEEALKLAGDKARSQFDAAAQNRIVVLTDGAANLGDDDPTALARTVSTLRQEGISFDACGVGVQGLDDSMLEALTRQGNGRYYVVNSPDDADAGFARNLAGALHPAAQNVKVQVRFNPARVQTYRLVGFEQHRLNAADFRNDQVTAAELADNEEGVAVYEIQPKPDGEGEIGDVFVRFRKPAPGQDAAAGEMVERSWTILFDPQAPTFAHASASMQLAGTAALLAEKLQGGERAKQIRLNELAPVVNRLRGEYAHDQRIQNFVTMFGETRRITGE